MDLNNLKNSWQAQALTFSSESETMDKVVQLDKKLEKENLYVSIAFASTIFVLGFAVFPLLKSTTSMLLMGALYFLMGCQAIVFWMRNFSVKNAISETPSTFINHLIKKLNYNLIVTNFLMPLYLLLLGAIISFYIYDLLAGFETSGLYILITISLCWSFLIGIFFYSWPKQRIKDQEIIIPMIKELEEMKKGY